MASENPAASRPPKNHRTRQFLLISILLIAPLLATTLPGRAMAEPGLGIEAGHEWKGRANLLRLNLSLPFWRTFFADQGLATRPFAEASVGRYFADGSSDGLWEAGLRLFLRTRLGHDGRFFAELGSGLIAIDKRRLDGDAWGSGVQFRSHAGLGLWLAERRNALIYRLSHSSNGSRESPNPGIDVHSLQLEWRFR